MFEIEIKGRNYIFNSKTISYIILGDESVPSKEARRVSIIFINGGMKCFCFENHEKAEQLYKQLFKRVKNDED